jgi:GGDEF domain-containing protein
VAVRRLESAVKRYNREARCGYDIDYSVGAVEFDPACHDDIDDLMAEADTLMYERKQARRRDVAAA